LALVVSPPAQAATVLQRVQADIEQGKYAEAQTLIKHNPNVASAAVAALVSAAQQDVTANPEASAQALKIAAAYAKDVNGDVATTVARSLQDIRRADKANTAYCLTTPLHTDICQAIEASAATIATAPAVAAATVAEPVETAKNTGGAQPDIQLSQQPLVAPTVQFQQPLTQPKTSGQPLQQVRALIAKGSFVEAQSYIKDNPAVTGAAVGAFVDSARQNVTTNPEVALKALQLAVVYARIVGPEVAAQVATVVQEIIRANKENTTYCLITPQHTELCQEIAAAAEEFLSDLQLAQNDEGNPELAQEPTAPNTPFQQPIQVLLPVPKPPSTPNLASGF
jgi:hypothetical protein